MWVVRRWLGKIPAGGTVRIRVWPLLAGISVLVVTGLFMLGMADPFKHLGAPTAVSIGILLATLAFGLFALMSVYCSFSQRQTVMNRGAYWHSTLASMVHLLVAVYLLFYGVIGLKTWA